MFTFWFISSNVGHSLYHNELQVKWYEMDIVPISLWSTLDENLLNSTRKSCKTNFQLDQKSYWAWNCTTPLVQTDYSYTKSAKDIKIPAVSCPFPNFDYKSDDLQINRWWLGKILDGHNEHNKNRDHYVLPLYKTKKFLV